MRLYSDFAPRRTRQIIGDVLAVAAVEARAWPFAADWDAWLTPAGLPVPTLQPGWDSPR